MRAIMTDRDADRDAFLAAIRANPDSDVPRLVFADWLDEHGEGDRAEFVRVQVELAKTPEPERKTPGKFARESEDAFRRRTCAGCRLNDQQDCRYCVLRGRERELWEDFKVPAFGPAGLKWYECLPGEFESSETPAALVRRGFIESVACPAADWLAHGDAVLASHPVRAVRLTTWPTHTHDGWPVNNPSRDDMLAYLARRWPEGIAFELPPEPILDDTRSDGGEELNLSMMSGTYQTYRQADFSRLFRPPGG